MARFSVTETAAAGFGVITHKPLAVLGWALAVIVAVILPTVLCFMAIGPQLQTIMQLAMAQPADGTLGPEAAQKLMQAQAPIMGMNLLVWLWSSLMKAVFAAAVFRAVLAPEQSAWAYLRIGSRELWLTLLLLVGQVLAMIVMFVVVLLVAVLTALTMVAGGENGQAVAIAVGCGTGGVALIVLIWLALRLSMAAPMTFADNQFRLFESWALTRGQGWRLLGVALLILLFGLCLEIVFGALLFGVMFATGGSLAVLSPEGVDAFMARPPLEILRALWPWLAGLTVLAALFAAIVQTVFYAPWAHAHRALTAQPDVFEP